MAPLAKIAALLSLSLLVSAQGTQFITGACTADADCASGCCGFTSGKCAAPFVANERGEGCGFGTNSPNGGGASNAALVENGNGGGAAAPAPAATAPAATAAPAPAAGNNDAFTNPAGAGLGNGAQFITGVCESDDDCASGCCGFRSGKCAGPVIAQTRDGGCGFGDNVPNDIAAQPFLNARSADPEAQDNTNPAGAGLRNAQQFITGLCTSDADCASGCCGFNSGKCAGPVIAQTRDGGCGRNDLTPNDNAARPFLNGGAAKRLGRRGPAYWL